MQALAIARPEVLCLTRGQPPWLVKDVLWIWWQKDFLVWRVQKVFWRSWLISRALSQIYLGLLSSDWDSLRSVVSWHVVYSWFWSCVWCQIRPSADSGASQSSPCWQHSRTYSSTWAALLVSGSNLAGKIWSFFMASWQMSHSSWVNDHSWKIWVLKTLSWNFGNCPGGLSWSASGDQELPRRARSDRRSCQLFVPQYLWFHVSKWLCQHTHLYTPDIMDPWSLSRQV